MPWPHTHSITCIPCGGDLPKDHHETAQTCQNLGDLYFDKGDIQESLRFHLKALVMREKTLGPDHPDTGISCAGVGSLYDCDKKYRLAVEYYTRALPALEKSGHPQVHELRERIEVLKSLAAE